MRLKSCRKRVCGRSVAPERTVRFLSEVFGQRYGIRLHEEKVAERLYWTALFIDGMDFRAMGKGSTPEMSRAGAYAEAAEWLTCRETEDLPGFTVTREDALEGDPIVSLSDLLAHVATATPPVLEAIRDLPDAQRWVDGFSLVHRRPVRVPIAYVELVSGPNGKASGNTLEEALEHAALEVFERRAQITVLRRRLVMPTLDAETIPDPVARAQLDALRSRDIEVVLKDLSFGGVLPCVGAYFHDPHLPGDRQFHHFFKVGASFDLAEAVRRTCTEYVQGRARDEFARNAEDAARILAPDFRGLPVMPPPADNYLSSFLFGFVPFRDAGFLREGPVVPFEPGPCPGDCRDAVELACGVCRTLGKDLVAVDLTDPDIGFSVVRVVVPGYSDVLPFHPACSPGLFRRLTRSEVLAMYAPDLEDGREPCPNGFGF